MSLIARKICPFCNSNKLNNIFSLSYKNKNLTEFLIKYYKNRIPLKKIQNYHVIKFKSFHVSNAQHLNLKSSYFPIGCSFKKIINFLIQMSKRLKRKFLTNTFTSLQQTLLRTLNILIPHQNF